jgi:flagellar biosynthesis protein FlhB
MSTKIERREDVNPERGEHEYGDVEFADPVNKKYPVDTPEHIRAAWSYINHKDNAAKYDAKDVKTIKDRIKRAAKEHGVEIQSH